MVRVTDQQTAICKRFGSSVLVPSSDLKVGIALQTLHLKPLNALRHPPRGWHVWLVHLGRPQLVPYLGLAAGWRVLLAPGYEDVWYDKSLLQTEF
jgi:hypothetical protein